MKRQRFFSSGGALFFLSLVFVLTMPLSGHAATFTVNSTADTAGLQANCVSGTGSCTLRSAIQAANASVGVADTIILPAGIYTLAIGGLNEDAAATGDLDITGLGGALTITGAGVATTIIDGGAIDGVFETIFAGGVGANATISGVTIRNGNGDPALGHGGGIHVGNGTTLSLNNSVVTACKALGANAGAGGVDNSGTLHMNTVAVTNNDSPGGGVNNGAAGVLDWTIGEVSGNFNSDLVNAGGGGIQNNGTITLTNVTISGNSSSGQGAGIDSIGTVTLQNVTISGNTSTADVAAIGGVRNNAGVSVTVRNTIISGNTPANCGGTITSQGNNIDNGATCGFVAGVSGDLPGTDPLLRALALNGGALRTHALNIGSPAIDAGTATGCPATDARGFARPVDGNMPLDGTATCDIGAFEFRPPTIVLAPASIDFGSVTIGLTSRLTVTATNAGDGDLIFAPVHTADLAPPFSFAADLCSNATLTLAQSCAITVQFAPTATVASTGAFHIPTNDPTKPLHESLVYAVSGTGVAGPVPNISVTDSIAPNNDLLAAFGDVTVGSSATIETITITNTGNANLVIGTVGGLNPIAAPFSKPITSDNCSGATIAPNASCTLSVHFAPTQNAASVDSFDIPSNDPGTPSITFNLSGSGVSATGNHPPAVPALASPANGAVVSGTTVTFTWTKSVDPDGDAVTHRFYNCADPTFAAAGCGPVNVASAGTSGLAFAGLGGLGAGIIMIGFVMGSGLKRSRKALLMLAAVFLTGTIFMACSSGGDDGAAPAPAEQMSHTVTGLTPATTYYWKVVADDGRDGTATSEVRSYTTQ